MKMMILYSQNDDFMINSADIEIVKIEEECTDLDPGRDGPQV